MTDLYKILSGTTKDHIIEYNGIEIHQDLKEALIDLENKAENVGFKIGYTSVFRSFDKQLSIWNRKCSGQLNVLDTNSVALNINQLSDKELVFAILRWSALPGASRHHWGTELDIYDKNAVTSDYEVQLISQEYINGGPFTKMSNWIKSEMANGSIDFYNPYAIDKGGVAPEAWHISYSPISKKLEKEMTFKYLYDFLNSQKDINLQNIILENLHEIYDRFICLD